MNWRGLSDALVHDGLLNGDLLTESLDWVLSLELLEFNRCVLIQEFVERKVATANTDLDVVFLYFDSNSLRTELVDTFALPHEHYLELGALWIIVDELSQFAVNVVLLHWDIHSNSLLQVNDVLLEGVNLDLSILELLEQLQRCLICLVDFLFKLKDVVSAILKFDSQGISSLLVVLLPLEGVIKLLLDILFLSEELFEGEDLAVAHQNCLLMRLNRDSQLVDT